MTTSHSTITVSDLDRKQLPDLLQMNIDSRDGFAYAGERLAEKHSSLSIEFHRSSQQRNDFCEKLKEIEEVDHEKPNMRGTIAASLHRTWMELRDKMSEDVDVSAVVAEARRGESYIKQAYASAIDTVVEPSLHALLNSQLESVKESYDWLNGLYESDEKRKSHAT